MSSSTKKPAKTATKSTGRVTPKKERTPTSVQEWKKAKGLPLDLPSGKTALCRNPGIRAFLKAGIIPNSLIPIVTEALERGESPSGGASEAAEKAAQKAVQKKLAEGMKKDSKFLSEMIDAIDNVTVYCVVEPPVRSDRWTEQDAEEGLCDAGKVGREIPHHERDDGQLYVDEVDFEDKTFIFQWAVGGTRDLERFRS